MTNPSNAKLAPFGSVAYLAGEYLYKNGPATEAELYLAIDFGCAPSKRAEKLQRALSNGWLAENTAGKLECGPGAREFFDYKPKADENESKPIGQIAAARQQSNIYERPALNKRFIPNSRGIRQDIPDWSRRPAGFCMKSIAGSEG